MLKVWFFELSGDDAKLGPDVTWPEKDKAVFGPKSPYSEDLFNSLGMQEVKAEFFKQYTNGLIPANEGDKEIKFNFKLNDGADKENYYTQVEWFLGSYAVQVKYKKVRDDANETVFDIKATATNTTGWRSGTRFPETWKKLIKESTGVEVDDVVSDGPRGETIMRKANSIISGTNKASDAAAKEIDSAVDRNVMWPLNRLVPRAPVVEIPEVPPGVLPSFGGNWSQEFKMEGQWVFKK